MFNLSKIFNLIDTLKRYSLIFFLSGGMILSPVNGWGQVYCTPQPVGLCQDECEDYCPSALNWCLGIGAIAVGAAIGAVIGTSIKKTSHSSGKRGRRGDPGSSFSPLLVDTSLDIEGDLSFAYCDTPPSTLVVEIVIVKPDGSLIAVGSFSTDQSISYTLSSPLEVGTYQIWLNILSGMGIATLDFTVNNGSYEILTSNCQEQQISKSPSFIIIVVPPST